jgi:hypothetical protein
MMKSAKDRLSCELAEPLDRPMVRRILTQGQMRSEFVVIAGVGCKDLAQVGLAEDDDVIEALSADRADQSLRMPVAAPWTPGTRRRSRECASDSSRRRRTGLSEAQFAHLGAPLPVFLRDEGLGLRRRQWAREGSEVL